MRFLPIAHSHCHTHKLCIYLDVCHPLHPERLTLTQDDMMMLLKLIIVSEWRQSL